MKKYFVLLSLFALALVAAPAMAADTVPTPDSEQAPESADLDLSVLVGIEEEIEMQGPACKKPGKGGDCICPQVYDPVCGCDGNTYSNSCFAGCSVRFWTEGPCGSVS